MDINRLTPLVRRLREIRTGMAHRTTLRTREEIEREVAQRRSSRYPGKA